MRSKILIVSTNFPPKRHVAVSRIEAYAKYLSIEHDVIIVTLGQESSTVNYEFENGGKCTVYYLTNDGLLAKLLFYTGNESWLLHKFKTLIRVVHNKLNVSHFANWAVKAERLIVDILNGERVDVLLSSYAPEDVLSLSYNALNKANNNYSKWVLDMRDEYGDEFGLPVWVRKRRRQNEIKFSKRADLILSVSLPLVELFKKRMLHAKEFMELRNGFDHDIPPRAYNKGDKLKIGYFGSFHGHRNPTRFFSALEKLAENTEIEVQIATKSVTFSIPSRLSDKVKILPFMSYSESIYKMSEMDVNLLVLPSSGVLGVFSGKIFDYLSSGRSILALVNPTDVAAKLINSIGAGYVVDFDNQDKIEKTISQIYSDWQNNCLKLPKAEDVLIHHRKQQVEKLNEWIKCDMTHS